MRYLWVALLLLLNTPLGCRSSKWHRHWTSAGSVRFNRIGAGLLQVHLLLPHVYKQLKTENRRCAAQN
jgi:hypothetical protein